VNNVLGFPFIFRGALDVRARAINDGDEDRGRARARRRWRGGRARQVLKAYGVAAGLRRST
jgi:malate dehydrogenase (oxaloacetate-decarboxylating)(NADP+)